MISTMATTATELQMMIFFFILLIQKSFGEKIRQMYSFDEVGAKWFNEIKLFLGIKLIFTFVPCSRMVP